MARHDELRRVAVEDVRGWLRTRLQLILTTTLTVPKAAANPSTRETGEKVLLCPRG